ncbi:hypothetical protein A3H26_02555 [candidate division WWE3 bacterium RIFCSPLOWO2_12_FULL_36_10]|uniref:Uncharacterized protein n=1 Tax=candidate division WWE3 bacterium RIFCSPLOWO2_12_FULL_36_10 TaxID=1802630 RepID=A0A1F4VJ69_UNCKA|nr:MAG: hypothetical protein A3H26_02555 [candidate division WWE3 bacterium RIFCSPLOWO2_12_FULL_36_10]
MLKYQRTSFLGSIKFRPGSQVPRRGGNKVQARVCNPPVADDSDPSLTKYNKVLRREKWLKSGIGREWIKSKF